MREHGPPVRALLAIIVAVTAGCATTAAQTPAEDPPQAAVIGRWHCDRNGGSVRIERRGDLYVMLGIADRSGVFSDPELVGEFRWQAESDRFVGRHLWGGRWGTKTDTDSYWGEEGSLEVRQITRDQIFVAYTDSKYKGGWIYQRMP